MRRLLLSPEPGHELTRFPPDLRVAVERIADEREPLAELPRLLQLVATLAPSAGAGRATLEAEPAPEALATLIEAADYRLVRSTLQLRRPLPLPVAAQSTVTDPRPVFRSFRPGEDDDAWVEVNNRAFAWHPDQSGWTVEDLRQRQREPWFRPEGFLLHESPDLAASPSGTRIDGFCWTKIHAEEEPPVGEIYVIAVDPASHRRGLGRALVVAGLEWLAGEHLDVAMLYVESDNAHAVALYRDLGFTEHQARRWWQRSLRA